MDIHKESDILCGYCYDTKQMEYKQMEYKQMVPAGYRPILKYMERVCDRYKSEACCFVVK